MSSARLDDILKNKKEGEIYHSLGIPEDYRVWTLEYKWNSDLLTDNNLEPIFVNVVGGEELANDTTRWDVNQPMVLKCGVPLERGYSKVHSVKSCSFAFGVDSIIELNEALTELAIAFGFKVFTVRNFRVFNREKNTIIEYQVHNPNGIGNMLATYRFSSANGSYLYPDVALKEQLSVIGSFYESGAKCEIVNETVKKRRCAIERKTVEVKKRTRNNKLRLSM